MACLRKLHTVTVAPTVTVNVYRDPFCNEYQVQIRRGRIVREAQTYYTDDRQDALDTCAVIAQSLAMGVR